MRVSGPSWRQQAHTVFAIGWSDFLLKYRGSFLGYIWAFVSPLAKFLVLLFVFRPLVGARVPYYPLYLFLGIILWEHFAVTTAGCIQTLRDKSPIVQKIDFPRILLMFAAGWTNLIVFCTHLLIAIVFAVLFGVPSFAGLPYLPLLLLQMFFLSLAVGMPLAAFSLRYRDIPHLWNVALQVLFWLTPVAYPFVTRDSFLREAAQVFRSLPMPSLWQGFEIFVRYQPLSILIHDARRILLYEDIVGAPTLAHMVGFTGLCFVLFGASALLFIRRSRYFAEEY